MNERGTDKAQDAQREGVMEYLWQRKGWWLLPLCVFFLLLGIIYLLGHFSRTDSEMYPTTIRHHEVSRRVC